MSKPKKPAFELVRASSNPVQLNQHADKFADKRTKRNRSRGDQKRKALAEQE
jgi:hypothetical protein